MERIRQLLSEALDKNLKQMIISNPRKKNSSDGDCVSASKIKVRPVMMNDGLKFQESRFVGTQVFHANYDKQELTDIITEEMADSFGQLELETSYFRATVLVSKKGTVTVKKKQLQGANRADGNVAENAGNMKNEEQLLSHNREKQYILKEGIPVPFLIDLGVQTKDGKIVRSKYDKFRQINRFLEFIQDVLPALPKDRKVSILDFGCGKSYLTFAMYYYLKVLNRYDIDIIGLDLKKDVIRKCNELKDKYGYDGIQFLEGDIRQYNEKEEVDMVVTLHACDTATDHAIAKAIAWNAKVILSVPCCQHELNGQMKCEELAPVLKYGLIKERMAALLTDGIRANVMEAYGYDTQVMEFIDMSHTPKNILLRGVKSQGFRKRGTTLEDVEKLMDMLHTKQTLMELLK
ncbi:MAG: SAM-dependent methyltransferase [Lachnospiraceae bacterium]|nr:SAM-dependent methyltransferase [Lachnospiraceae bacterium]